MEQIKKETPAMSEIMGFLYGQNTKVNMTLCMESLARLEGGKGLPVKSHDWTLQYFIRDCTRPQFSLCCDGVYDGRFNSSSPLYSLGWLFKSKGLLGQGCVDPFHDFIVWSFDKEFDWCICAEREGENVLYSFTINQDEEEAMVDYSFTLLMANVINHLKEVYVE